MYKLVSSRFGIREKFLMKDTKHLASYKNLTHLTLMNLFFLIKRHLKGCKKMIKMAEGMLSVKQTND